MSTGGESTQGKSGRGQSVHGKSLDEKKAALLAAYQALAQAAEQAGLVSLAEDVRETRLPRLAEERLVLVVLGEFNRGKSTFLNALLGRSLLPVGITPTTPALVHVSYGEPPSGEVVLADGQRHAIEPTPETLASWLTVEGLASRSSASQGAPEVHHVELRVPAPLLAPQVTLVDTPGVNDLNEQRAEITYGYVPRADAALMLLDGTQILTASERQFLEERILRTTRERLVFVVTKMDLLDEDERRDALRFAQENLAKLIPEPAIFPVSSRREAAGRREESGFGPLLAHLDEVVGPSRRKVVLDHALADAQRLAGFVRQSLGLRERSLALPLDELEGRMARAKEKLGHGRRSLDEATQLIAAETAGLKARVRQDLADFANRFRESLPAEIAKVPGEDVRRYLSFFIQDAWKTWVEHEGERMAVTLEALAERVIEVANENVRTVTEAVSGELGPAETKVDLVVDSLKYDVSVFALGALGTTVFLFVNNLVGGLLTLATPLLAMVLRGRLAEEIKAEAAARAPATIDRVAVLVGEKLEAVVEDFATRLTTFVTEAGLALERGVAEVLDRALAERRRHTDTTAASEDGRKLAADFAAVKAVDESLAEIRQAVWLA
jgi:small GTP-binding protein